VDQAWLAELAGIGPKIAMSLVRERQRRSGFHDWAEILEVEGIGATRLRVLQDATRIPGVRQAAGAADTSRERT
jgi:DNA uptake protein ComE-like DNA-binding protein